VARLFGQTRETCCRSEVRDDITVSGRVGGRCNFGSGKRMDGAGGKALMDQYRSGHCVTLAAVLLLCARPWEGGQPAGDRVAKHCPPRRKLPRRDEVRRVVLGLVDPSADRVSRRRLRGILPWAAFCSIFPARSGTYEVIQNNMNILSGDSEVKTGL